MVVGERIGSDSEPQYSQRRAVRHELGHAVGVLAGGDIEQGGIYRPEPERYTGQIQPQHWPTDMDGAVCAMAGPLAEMILSGDQNEVPSGSRSDLSRAGEAAQAVADATKAAADADPHGDIEFDGLTKLGALAQASARASALIVRYGQLIAEISSHYDTIEIQHKESLDFSPEDLDRLRAAIRDRSDT